MAVEQIDFSYNEYKNMVKEAICNGEIRLTPGVELGEIDFAIQYAIAKEQERQQKAEIIIPVEEMPELIRRYCGSEVFFTVFPKRSGQ